MARKIMGATASDYEVGRGKPPSHSRFKKGESGNPGGRRKEAPNLRTVVNAVLTGQIEVSENGRVRKVSVLEAIILRQVQEALRGQPRAIESLLDRYERCAATGEPAAQELLEDDLEVLGRALRRSRPVADVADPLAPADDEPAPDPEAPMSAPPGEDWREGGRDG